MEAVLSWLNRPLVPDSPILIWMALALCAGLALALILVLALVRKRKKRAAHEKDPVTAKPGPLPVLELANLQGLGSREEQQDAFGISPVSRLEEDGLLAVLCDGMGGMADLEGKALTNETDLTLTFTESYLESADISQFSMDFSPYGKDDISEIGTTNRVYIPAEYGAAYTIVFAGNEADGFTATLEE